MSDSHSSQEKPSESHSHLKSQPDRFDSIERRLFFRITRFAAFFMSLLLVATIVGCLVYIYNADRPEKPPTADDVVDTMTPPTTSAKTSVSTEGSADQQMTAEESIRAEMQLGKSTDVLVGLRIPVELQVLFAAEENNLGVIRGWLNELAESDRQVFLDQLGRAAMLAKQRGIDQVAAINEFHDRHASARARSESSKASASAMRLNAFYVATLALTLLVLLSLILVLLAIERNTRHLEQVR